MSDGQGRQSGRSRPPQRWTDKRSGRSNTGGKRSSGKPDGTTGRERAGTADSRGGPEVPDDITGRELDSSVRAELVGLSRPAADRVARHLVAAGRFLDEEPELAVEHAWAARREGARLAVVREACGYAAYAAGQYERALAELRAARRMSGSPDYVAVMADCERGLGRPERALELGSAASRDAVNATTWLELRIVLAGARRDMGQLEAALGLLDLPELRSDSTDRWAARLRYAYADTLEAMGRSDEARDWFARAEIADADSETDATERRAALEDAAAD